MDQRKAYAAALSGAAQGMAPKALAAALSARADPMAEAIREYPILQNSGVSAINTPMAGG